jgi:hypothetical protein
MAGMDADGGVNRVNGQGQGLPAFFPVIKVQDIGLKHPKHGAPFLNRVKKEVIKGFLVMKAFQAGMKPDTRGPKG